MGILDMVGVFFSGLTKSDVDNKKDIKSIKKSTSKTEKELEDIKAELKRNRQNSAKNSNYKKSHSK